MNKRKIKRMKIADLYEPLVFNCTKDYKIADRIYVAKYKEIYHILSSNITKNNTYNILTFKDLDMAKEFINSVCEKILTTNIEGGFKVTIDNTVNELSTENGTETLWRRDVKLMGDENKNASQQKFLSFSIEELDLVPYHYL